MGKARLEAFSDGVLAIIITIMVLELKVPHGGTLASLAPLMPVFLSYVLSFIYVGIYWNNHHHLLHTIQKVNGAIMWANLHLLFWLSLMPFVTGWMGENHFTSISIVVYGGMLLMSALAFTILQLSIIAHQGKDSLLASAIGRDLKGKLSLLIYVIAIALALAEIRFAGLLYVLVAIIWLVPDRRVEQALGKQ